MNLQRREEIRELIAEIASVHIEGMSTAIEIRALDAMRNLLAHIDTLEQTAAERVIADGSRGPMPDYTVEGSAWVPPVEARAVVVNRDCGSCRSYQDSGEGSAKCDGCGGDEMPNWSPSRALASARAIPADRVLGDGMVQISERELACMRAELEYRRAESDEAPDSVLDPLWDAFDALRANQGGA